MRSIIPKLFIFWLFVFSAWLTQDAVAQNCVVGVSVTGGTTVCQGETVTLQSSNNFSAISWQWFRNDVAIPGATNATHDATQAGEYYVVASGATTCANVRSPGTVTVNVIVVPDRPTFNFTPATAICAGQPIVFSIITPEPDVTYTWLLGDGRSRVGASFPYTYTSEGTGTVEFDVEVIATRRGCNTAPVTQRISVRQTPVVSFAEAKNFAVCVPDSVEEADLEVFAKLANNTQAPYLGNIREYVIDWGDGNGPQTYTTFPDTLQSPNAYTEFGDYPITITAVNNNDCPVTVNRTFSVSQKPKANATQSKEPAGTPQDCTPIIVSLGDSSSGGGLTYKWEIAEPNNGGYSIIYGGLTEDSIRIRFETPGVFNIDLIVQNSCGADTAQQSVVVGYPQAQLPSDIFVCGDTTIQYNAQNVLIDPNFATPGTVRYEWFVDGPGGRRTSAVQYPSFDFNTPGEYAVSLKVTNNCGTSDDLGQTPQPQRITVYPLPVAPTVQGVTICEGDAATLSPTSPGPDYNWYAEATGGTPLNRGTTFDTGPLTSTTIFYAETINANNCTSPRTAVTVTVVPAIEGNLITMDQNICAGDAPAQLTGSTPTGGVGNTYVYTWQRSITGPSAGFAVAPGTNGGRNYTPGALNQTTWFRRLVNSGTCAADTSNIIQITVVPRLQNNTISGDQGICANETAQPLTGTRPTGGDGVSLGFEWQLSTQGPDAGFVAAPGGNSENYEPEGLTQTTWFRRVADSGGCRVISNVVKIDVLPALQNNTVGQAQTICTGATPQPLVGSAPTGGSGNFTYQWLSSTTNANFGFTAAAGTNNGQNYTPGNLTQSTWFRRVVTTAACEADTSAAVQITINQGVMNNSIVVTQATVCEGDAPAQLTGSTPSGGTGSYTYLWESSISGPTTGFNPAGGANTGASYTPPALTQNTWFRRVVTSAGCDNASDAVQITINARPAVPTLTVRDATACTGGTATLSVAPNGNNTTYEWFTEATGGQPIFVGPEFTTPALTQNVTYYVQAVNQSNCASPTRAAASVRIVEPVASAGEDVTIIQGRVTELRATGGVTYRWEPAAGLSSQDVFNPVARPEVTTTYTVTVTTEEGCTATDEVTITVIPAIQVPNAFSPNRDGVNDVWEIENIANYPEARVEIFNRWGNRIFSSNGYGTPWDGTYQNQDLPVATYYYMIYLNGAERPISGNVTIIR